MRPFRVLPAREALRKIFGTVNPLPNLGPSWNLAPTQRAPAVRLHPETKQRHLNLLIWGLVPYFTSDGFPYNGLSYSYAADIAG